MDFLAELAGNVGLGLSVALSIKSLTWCIVGIVFGTLVGVIPGVGTLAAISMLFPLTFHLDPTTALIMLAGIYYGTTYGGSTAAILLNVPGTPSSAVVCLDGHPMAQNGRAGVALFMTTVASFVGASIGIILLMLFSPVLAGYALKFGPAEYFTLMVLGLVAAAAMSVDNPVKGLAMVVLGAIFGVIGMDLYTGTPRFTFGHRQLLDGVGIIPVAMGIFGVSEVLFRIRGGGGEGTTSYRVSFRSMIPTGDDIRRSWGPMARGSAIGSFFGALPGTGATIASFIAYATEKRVARDKSRFGKGAIEGVMGPETANNAADQTAFIPTLALGIPGTPTMGIMLGVLMIHGISPGPNLIKTEPDLFWGLVMSFWVGNILLLIINIPFIGIWIRLLRVPYHLLYPAILMFICIGIYSVSHNVFHIWLAIVFGFVGYLMRLMSFSPAPLLLGFVLGPLLEENFRRAMLLSHGDLSTFLIRPLAGAFLVLATALLVWSLLSAARHSRE